MNNHPDHRKATFKPKDRPGLGDDIPCSKCGAVALDTGLECDECGHDMAPELAGDNSSSEPARRVLMRLSPGAPEASALIDSVLAEYNYPSNPKNAARAGWVAAMRWLSAPSQAQAGGVRMVTLRSASMAINHVSLHNGPGRLAEATAMLEEVTPPAPRAPSIGLTAREVAHQVFAMCEATEDLEPKLGDTEAAGHFLRGRRFEAKQIRRAIGTWLTDEENRLAAPASAGVEEFPLPEPDVSSRVSDSTMRSYEVKTYSASAVRDVLRSYSTSLGLQARTEGEQA